MPVLPRTQILRRTTTVYLVTNNMLLDISQIRLDGGTQIRAGLDESVVAEYAEHLPSLPPVRVLHDGTNFWLTDGFHRIAAHLRVGHTNCNVVFETPGQREDAVELACGANSTHGLPRTPDDKRRAVEALLKLEKWKTKSDREVAKQCGVGATLVGDVRAKLTSRGEQSPQVREITRNGKTVQLDTTYIGRRPAAPPPAPEAPQRVEALPAPVVRPRADEAPRWPAERPREATPPKESAQQRTVPLPMVQDVVPTSKPKQSTATTLVSWEARILAAAHAYADADAAMHTNRVLAVPERLLVDQSTAKRKVERRLIQTIVEARDDGWKYP